MGEPSTAVKETQSTPAKAPAPTPAGVTTAAGAGASGQSEEVLAATAYVSHTAPPPSRS